MRGILFTLGCFGLLMAIAVAGGGRTAIAHLHHKDRASRAIHSSRNDVLPRELYRYNLLGSAASDDARCEAAWAESRRHFFNDGGERPKGARP
jgi:conjugative transfer region protein TrbK